MFGSFEIDLALDLDTVTSYAETEPAADPAEIIEAEDEIVPAELGR